MITIMIIQLRLRLAVRLRGSKGCGKSKTENGERGRAIGPHIFF
jgi:hypothetical protein